MSYLRTFDISPAQQARFLEALGKKYGSQFLENPNFMLYVEQYLAYRQPHLMQFADLIQLEHLLSHRMSMSA